MKRSGRIFAVLAFVFALVLGAAGGAVARDAAPAHHASHHAPAHHASHHAPAHQSPANGSHHKASLAVAAPCCPAAEAPTRHSIAAPVTMSRIIWTPRPTPSLAARDIAPEPPPPKTRL